MKNIAVCFIMMLVLLAGCSLQKETVNPSSNAYSEQTISNSENENLLTHEEALEIAKEKIKPPNEELIIEIDGETEVDGQPYFSVHEYYVSAADEQTGLSQTFTMGWYRINRKTGQLYKFDMLSKQEKWDLIE